jgi:hypothetical protein
MLMFFNLHRVVPFEFVPQGQPVNQPETGLTNVTGEISFSMKRYLLAVLSSA